ncbi:MAG: hypothetical protein IJB51_07230, partial [Clostridia bacterium]|nr:hypothetical protein [Clostridia bacterium]
MSQVYQDGKGQKSSANVFQDKKLPGFAHFIENADVLYIAARPTVQTFEPGNNRLRGGFIAQRLPNKSGTKNSPLRNIMGQ